MKLEDLTTIDQLADFLSGTQLVAFSVISKKDDCYHWIRRELVRFRYLKLPRSNKGVVIRYLMKVSGYSRQQITRLITQYRETGRVQRRQRTASGFKRNYTPVDIRLLAAMDERHDTPCGPAVKKLCERAWQVFGEMDYATLAGISVSHLYNLRKSQELSAPATPLPENPIQDIEYWRSSQAAPRWPARLYPHRYSTSGRF